MTMGIVSKGSPCNVQGCDGTAVRSLNTKKIEVIDKDIENIKNEATEKINKLQIDRNTIVGQIIKDQGGVEKLEKLINANNKVQSK